MEPSELTNSMQNTGDAEAIRKEMIENQKQQRKLQANKMDQMLANVADNMKKEEVDIRDDGRRHIDMKDTLSTLQQELKSMLQY